MVTSKIIKSISLCKFTRNSQPELKRFILRRIPVEKHHHQVRKFATIWGDFLDPIQQQQQTSTSHTHKHTFFFGLRIWYFNKNLSSLKIKRGSKKGDTPQYPQKFILTETYPFLKPLSFSSIKKPKRNYRSPSCICN